MTFFFQKFFEDCGAFPQGGFLVVPFRIGSHGKQRAMFVLPQFDERHRERAGFANM